MSESIDGTLTLDGAPVESAAMVGEEARLTVAGAIASSVRRNGSTAEMEGIA